MIYNDFDNIKLSSLGLGCMRLPHLEKYEDIDMPALKRMVAYAMEKGINYYDTAWGYHKGNSEIAMGEALSEYPRESFYLASKFPGYDLKNMDKIEEIFEKQLEKCKVEYFDFYLFHNVCEMNIDAYLDKKYGIFDYIMEQKEKGRIRHVGFSVHGNLDTTKRFLNAYGKHMEFCQIQLNWLDWDFQDAKAKVSLLNEWNISIWVMEPLRGGSLCKIAPEYEARLKELNPKRNMTEWAFRFIQSIIGVTVTLSGMSNFEQLSENIGYFEEFDALTVQQRDTLMNIAKEMTEKKTLACTSCRYCTEKCPKAIDIPWLVKLYNEHIYTGGGFIAPMALNALEENKRPAACIGCKACEAVCPQGIKISEMMSDFAEKMKK